MLSELEEVISFKLVPERRDAIKQMWWDRLQVSDENTGTINVIFCILRFDVICHFYNLSISQSVVYGLFTGLSARC